MNALINNLQNNPEGKNSSMQAQIKSEKQESLVQALSSEQWEITNVNPRDSLDITKVVQTNPDFVDFDFSEEDIQYFNTVEESLMQDPYSGNFNKIAWQIAPERTDLAKVVFGYIFPKVLRLKAIN